MKRTERHWWLILVESETRSAYANDLVHWQVALRARHALVKEFGLNLDTLFDEADLDELYDEEKQRMADEEIRLASMSRFLKLADELIAASDPKEQKRIRAEMLALPQPVRKDPTR